MKISEYKGEEAIELIADILEPLTVILQNDEIRGIASKGAGNLELVRAILKHGKKEVLEILAIIDGENPETYQPNIFVLPKRLIELFSQPEMRELFISQAQKKDDIHSGSATENIEVVEE